MASQHGKKTHIAIFGVFLLFAFWVAFALVYGKGGVIARKNVLGQIARLKAEIARLESGTRHLDGRIENLKTNRHTVESHARELGFKKEGETIYRFLKKQPETGR
jgi:cell division protein FtsB